MLSLIEKAQQNFDEKQAAELERKMREQTFTLTDFLEQFKQVRGMGSLDQLMGMIPGVNTAALKDVKVDERQLDRVEAMILLDDAAGAGEARPHKRVEKAQNC